MVGAVAAVILVAAVVVVGATAAIVSAKLGADAAEKVAETNAKATVAAAHEAATAQIEAAKQDAGARMHESDVAFNTDLEYLKQEKWSAEREDSTQNYYASTQAQVDSIDFYYGSEGSWGLGQEQSYDYGGDFGDGGSRSA